MTEIHSFLGLAGYYRRFIEGLSKIARPVTSLTQKGKEFKWIEACEKSFQELKTRLTTTPILTLPDIHRSFVVYCDASRQGLGCVLMLSTQNFCPVPRTHAASRKGLLDGAVDPPSFSVGMVDPAHSSRDTPVNLTLQLIRRESLSVI